jgi:UDP:flavonoid glycosyltransferase YjiC (YdhE family)
VRVLFTTQPGDGHIRPVTPLALALQDRGHQVRVATAASFAPVVRGLGLNPVPAGLDWVESEAEATFPGFTAARADALPTFAGRCAGPMAQDIALLAVHWHPDVSVREHLEWGGWVAAEELGVPSIHFNLGRHIPREVVLQRAGEALAALRKERGLPVDVGLRSLDGTVCFDTSPPSLAEPSSAAVNMVSIRPAVQLGLGLPLPDWCRSLGHRPVVYASLGTVFNGRLDGHRKIIEALATTDLDLLVSLGSKHDPAALGHLPANVHVEPVLPQTALLPLCDAVVSHVGRGTMMEALANGVPICCIPLAADQPGNAAQVVASGTGLSCVTGIDVVPAGPGPLVDLDILTPAMIRVNVLRLLTEPSFRARAREVQAEIAAMPGPGYAAEVVESVVSALATTDGARRRSTTAS